MKLKCQPEDFQVEELPLVRPGPHGRFTLYRLTKRGIGTLEALETIRHRWNLGQAAIQYGGLKDRHAVTIQYLTILEGPNRPIQLENLELEPLGRVSAPYGPRGFRGNRFQVVIRDLTPVEVSDATRAVAELPRDGLPNYFDDQRFGSVGFGGEFIGEAWIQGNPERALWLAIAEANPSDRGPIKQEKEILRETWGQWTEAKARLPRSHSRSLVTYLVDHPQDFKGAFSRLRRDLRSIYFSAYQSFLWNRLLGRVLTAWTRPEQRVDFDFRVDQLPLHRGLDPDQAERLSGLRLPLPASRSPFPAGELGAIATAVLTERNLTWDGLKVRHLKDVFLSKGDRAALFYPHHLRSETGADELYRGRRKLVLDFELEKGCYATLVVKRLTEAP